MLVIKKISYGPIINKESGSSQMKLMVAKIESRIFNVKYNQKQPDNHKWTELADHICEKKQFKIIYKLRYLLLYLAVIKNRRK